MAIASRWLQCMDIKRTDCIVWLWGTLASLVKQFSATYKYAINMSQYSICNHVKVCNVYDMHMNLNGCLQQLINCCCFIRCVSSDSFALFTYAVQPWKFNIALSICIGGWSLHPCQCILVTQLQVGLWPVVYQRSWAADGRDVSFTCNTISLDGTNANHTSMKGPSVTRNMTWARDVDVVLWVTVPCQHRDWCNGLTDRQSSLGMPWCFAARTRKVIPFGWLRYSMFATRSLSLMLLEHWLICWSSFSMAISLAISLVWMSCRRFNLRTPAGSGLLICKEHTAASVLHAGATTFVWWTRWQCKLLLRWGDLLWLFALLFEI